MVLLRGLNTYRSMIRNYCRFFISFNVTLYLSNITVTFILDVVVDGVIGNLMCGLI